MKVIPISLLIAAPCLAGDPKSPLESPRDGWEWTLSAGPAVRNVGTVKISSGYRSGGFFLPSLVGGDSLVLPAVGDEGQYDERFYDDGYVRQDAGTSVDGSTWFWGYDDAVQVRGDNLLYSATGSQSVLRDDFRAPAAGAYSKDSLRGFSPHVQFDARSPHRIAGFRVGFSAGFDFTQVDQSLAYSNFAASQFRDDYRLDLVDTYALGGVIPPLAPYQGSQAGPGPLIGNLPSSRVITPVLVFTDSAAFSNQVFSSIDMNVSSLALGPTFGRSMGPVELAFQAGVILNVYQWEARQSESLTGTGAGGSTTLARWAEEDTGTKFRPGVYLQADISYDVGNRFEIGGFARLDTASEFRAQAGPTIFKVDPSGFSAGFQVRYQLP